MAEQLRTQRALQKIEAERLEVVRQNRRRQVAHEEASPKILETLHLLVEKIEDLDVEIKDLRREHRPMLRLTALIALGTIILVLDIFFR